jgi:hypothetical protein
MTQLTRQGEPFANFDPAYTTQKMVLSGYKSGGTIHIKKKNKGKFSKVRDYVDYKNNK